MKVQLRKLVDFMDAFVAIDGAILALAQSVAIDD
jgi:hypothetical protein